MIRLACELRRSGVDVRMLFTSHGGALTSLLDQARVPWEVMRPSRPGSSTLQALLTILRLAWRIMTCRPSVVCAWLAGAAWPALLPARAFTRARRVVGFRGEVVDRDLRWQAPLFRLAVKHAHVVTINSPTLRDEAVRWSASPDRIMMIPNGVELPSSVANTLKQPATAVVVANFRSYKGHDVLAQALNRTPRSAKASVVRLCGEGQERESTARALESQIRAGKVIFVDEPANVARELAAAQFAIHPSRTEGMSNAILEQLAHGLPVVATDVGATSLLVRDGISGVLVPPGDFEALRQGIDLLESDPVLRERLGKGARATAEEFSWESCARRYLIALGGGWSAR